MKILKKYVQNRKGLQKLDIKHVPHAPKEDFQKKSKFWVLFGLLYLTETAKNSKQGDNLFKFLSKSDIHYVNLR